MRSSEERVLKATVKNTVNELAATQERVDREQSARIAALEERVEALEKAAKPKKAA